MSNLRKIASVELLVLGDRIGRFGIPPYVEADAVVLRAAAMTMWRTTVRAVADDFAEFLFFGEDDDALDRDLLAGQCRKHGVAVFCLLPDAQPTFISFSSPSERRRSGARSAPAPLVYIQRAAQGRPSLSRRGSARSRRTRSA